MTLGRRTFLGGTAAGAVALGATATPWTAAPALARSRLTLPSGVQSGDVTTDAAVLWARSSGPGRLHAEVRGGRFRRRVRGPWAGADSDLTAKVALRGLPPGRDYEVRLHFESEGGARGEVGTASFSTASIHPVTTSFVWTGDTCGQGWGINPDLGGMTGYRAMHATRPDFFIHCGDTVYSDSPLAESVVEPDGQVWRNLVTPEVAKVAETLTEFRGRHRYNQLDRHLTSMYADVPVLAQWDDHETHNNWYPGQILDDDRYTERRVDVLAKRSRQAWQENMPIADRRAHRGSDGFAAARIYRKVSRGPHLDVFLLDMRTFKSPNTPGLETTPTHIFGAEQVEWLVREVSRSRATWKVISADLPLGLVVPDATNQESLSNGDPGRPLGREDELATVLSGFKRHGVRNVLWLTADVHYCAAHHYDPARAAYTDFDPFWELVAGPISSGTFGPNVLDGTFGPEVVFSRSADYPGQSPRGGHQFFGHARIGRDGAMHTSLRNAAGSVLWSRTMEPAGA